MKLKLLALAVTCLAGSAANATSITLDFEGIAPHPNSNSVLIQNYYNGGTASNGNSGTNLGVAFSTGATLLCLNTETVFCSNTSKGGGGIATSRLAAMYFPNLNPIMDVAAGFDTGFSMAYTNPFAANVTIEIFDGLGATGTLLASAALGSTVNGAGGACASYGNPNYCPFADFSLGFAGIAKSVKFGGTANISTYDDFTFGSTVVGGGTVPEPGTLALVGVALLGMARARRQFKA
jgi:predicted outer membrane repeat protein